MIYGNQFRTLTVGDRVCWKNIDNGTLSRLSGLLGAEFRLIGMTVIRIESVWRCPSRFRFTPHSRHSLGG